MKIKVIIISLISFFIILGGIIFLRFYTISEDFSVFTGIKAMTSLLTGSDVVEFTGNGNQQFIMIKPESETDLSKSYEPVISYLEATKEYLCHLADSGALSCEEDPLLCMEGKENLWIESEMYTKYFVVFKLPKEKETTN